MSQTATRTTAALLCGVVLVALGLAFIALPDTEVRAESLDVELDFDPFTPGVTQTRTSDVVIPVESQVTDASISQVAAGAMQIDTSLTICGASGCRALVPGLDIDPGPHSLRVEATLVATPQGDIAPGATSGFTGQIRIVERHQSSSVDASLLIAVGAIGLTAIALATLIVQPRRRVSA
jgi:hypothetical protein